MKEQIMFCSTKKVFVKIVKLENPKSDIFECMVLPDNTETVLIERKDLTGQLIVKVVGSKKDSKDTICIGKFSLDIREPILDQLSMLMGTAFTLKGLCLDGKLIEADDTVQSKNIVSGTVL